MAEAYDHEEQEQIAALRAWWSRFGNVILTAVTVVFLCIAAWNGWRWYERRQAAAASATYEQLLKAVSEKDLKRLDDVAGEILEKYSGTGFAPLAALVAARAHYDGGDLRNARAKLQWVVDHAREPEFRSMARVRLANVMVDEKAYDDAHKVLDGEMAGQFASIAADLNGDIYLLQGNKAAARTAYKLALEKVDEGNPGLRERIQRKIDDLGAAG